MASEYREYTVIILTNAEFVDGQIKEESMGKNAVLIHAEYEKRGRTCCRVKPVVFVMPFFSPDIGLNLRTERVTAVCRLLIRKA